MLKLSELKSFLTGSFRYGTPHEHSDVDLVVLVAEADMLMLMNVARMTSDEPAQAVDYGEDDTACLRFGRLNLICCTRLRDFETWRRGTEDLAERKPVTRTEAVEWFRHLRNEAKALAEFKG